MKLKTTIILLIAAVIGIIYVFLYEKKQVPQEEWARMQKKIFPYFKASMVKKIELNNEQGKVVLERDENSYWYITVPQRLRADNSEINSILSDFEFMSKIGSFAPEEGKPFDLKDYGLDVPKTSITMYTGITTSPDKIRVAGPQDKYTVFLGNKLAAGDNVYLKIGANDEVNVVPGGILEKASKNILDLRSKWVFSFDEEAVDLVQINTNEFELVCERKGEFWRLVEPLDDLADLQIVKGIIKKLKDQQINYEDFLSGKTDDLTMFGLDTPRFTVSVREKGAMQSVIFGNSLDNKVYVKRLDEPTIFLLQDSILADLSRKPNELRDRALIRFDSYGTYGVNKIEIKTANDSISIEKALDLDWKITQPVKLYADQDTVKNFIEKIKTLEIVDFVSDKPADLSTYGLQNPVFEISVTKEENRELAKFLVGNKLPDGHKCYVKRVGEEPVYTVPTVEFYDKIENALLAFRDKLVCEYDRDLVRKIVIEKPDRTFLCNKTGEEDEEGRMQWALSKPVQTIADPDVMNQIVWDLSYLKAENHVVENPEDLSAYGLDDPRIKLSVTYEKVAVQMPEESEVDKEENSIPERTIETRTLLIGDHVVADNDKVNSYCMFDDRDIVFELSWPKIKNFNAELVPTRIFSFLRSQVKGIALRYENEDIEFEKRNNMWEIKNSEMEDLLGREVDYYVRVLERLKGDYIEQYKATNLTQYSLDRPRLTITVSLENGDAALFIGKKKDAGGYYVKNRDSDYIYVVSADSIIELMKKEKDFSQKVAGALPPLKASPGETPLGTSPHGKPESKGVHGGFH
ncbi:MAG: DUF4340 domain-containing protein [Candidatus Brocadiaceae bacterium]|nr:DUF4340 domain-containing protein [Candidatus Brocadiaceae bacterium]